MAIPRGGTYGKKYKPPKVKRPPAFGPIAPAFKPQQQQARQKVARARRRVPAAPRPAIPQIKNPTPAQQRTAARLRARSDARARRLRRVAKARTNRRREAAALQRIARSQERYYQGRTGKVAGPPTPSYITRQNTLVRQLEPAAKASYQRGGVGDISPKSNAIRDLTAELRFLKGDVKKQLDVDKDRVIKFMASDPERAGVSPAAVKVLENVSRPIYGIAAAAKHDVQQYKKHGIKGLIGHGSTEAAKRGVTLKEKTLFSDVLKEAGMPALGPTRSIAGFILDVGLDPTTYLTAGTASVTKQAAIKSSQKAARDVAREAVKKGVPRSEARKLGQQAGYRVRQENLKRAKDATDRGVSVRFAGKELPGVLKGTAAARRGARKATPAPVRRGAAKAGLRTRAVAAPLNAQVRPGGIGRGQFSSARQIKRERRATEEAYGRQASGRAVSLAALTSRSEWKTIRDAIERGDIDSLKGKAAPVKVPARRRRGRKSANAVARDPDRLYKLAREMSSDWKGLRDRAVELGVPVGWVGEKPPVQIPEVTADVGAARQRVGTARRAVHEEETRLVRQAERSGVAQGRAEVLTAQATKRAERQIARLKDLSAKYEQQFERAIRAAAKVKNPKTKAKFREDAARAHRARNAAQQRIDAIETTIGRKPPPTLTKAERERGKLFELQAVPVKGTRDVPLAQRELAEARSGGTTNFKPRPEAKNPPWGRGLIDENGNVHTWNESEGTHAEMARALGVQERESFIINTDGTLSIHGGSGRMTDHEIAARVLAQDRRLKPPKEMDRRPNAARPVDAEGKERPNLYETLERVLAEREAKPEVAAARERVATAKQKPGQRIVTRTRGGRPLIAAREERTAAEQELAAMRTLRREQTTARKRAEKQAAAREAEAKGYVPRVPKERLTRQRHIEGIEDLLGDAIRTAAGGTRTPRGPHTKRRTQTRRMADIERVDPRYAETISDDLPLTYESYGRAMGRTIARAEANRKLIEQEGRVLEPGKPISIEPGERVYRRDGADLVELDPNAAGAKYHEVKRELDAIEKGTAKGDEYAVLPKALVDDVMGRASIAGGKPAEAFNRVMGRWKSIALGTPAYLVRNGLSDAFASYQEQGAARLAANYVRSQRALSELSRNAKAYQWFDTHVGKGKTVNINGHEVPYGQLALEAEAAGAIRQGRVAELAEQMERGKKLKKPQGESGWRRTVQRVEDSARLATYIGYRRRGYSTEQAANKVASVHFDYGDLTSAEQSVRALMPFYTFTARNLPRQAGLIFRRPGAFATLEKARQEGRKAAGLPEDFVAGQNPYEQRQLGIPLKLGDNVVTVSFGGPFVDLNDVAPQNTSAFSDPVGFGKALGALPVTTLTKRGVELLGPWKAIGELYYNYSAFYKDDISKEGSRFTPMPFPLNKLGEALIAADPKAARDEWGVQIKQDKKSGKKVVGYEKRIDYALRQALPGLFGVGLRQATPETNARGFSRGQELLGIGGIRATPLDPRDITRNQLYDEREKLMRRRSDLNEAGIYERNATPEYRQTARELSRVERQLDRINRQTQAIYKGRPTDKRPKRKSDPLDDALREVQTFPEDEIDKALQALR